MKKIVAINTSPRTGWNTDMLVNEAARGAASGGAETEVIQLYRLDPFRGCRSCFGCMTAPDRGRCVVRDGLYPVLEKIREADGLIIGTPIYLADVTAGFRALYERLLFQYATYNTERVTFHERRIPVLLIFTSNIAVEDYPAFGYDRMVETYRHSMEHYCIGPAKVLLSGDTLQVPEEDYARYEWNKFSGAAKRERREREFPKEMAEAYRMGKELL